MIKWSRIEILGLTMFSWEIANLDSDGFLLEKWKGWESWDLGEVNDMS